ncbi:hypothetical protein POM88_009317 [Heracleum sosnowskyi]|uniref:Ubiquitin-like protease family profile domain-containing protein n=1 Tax=Heracleum sosnowskyi TaxID=360622 RepID=A0AAD8N7D2_9APIA|nr:hypothetical protein POM88_009317 [Heracleum sosnowskyi]
MVHTRFSSASQSPSATSVSHSKRKLKVSPKKLKGKNSKFTINFRRKKLTFTDDVVPPPELELNSSVKSHEKQTDVWILNDKLGEENEEFDKGYIETFNDGFIMDEYTADEVPTDVVNETDKVPNVSNEVPTDVAIEVANEVASKVTEDAPLVVEAIFEVANVVSEVAEHTSKVVVLRNTSGTSGKANITPALPKRAIRLPSYLQSPFLQHVGSSSYGSTDSGMVAEIKIIKDICPLDNNIGKLPDMELCVDYYNWLDKGVLLKKNRSKFYSKEDNTIIHPIKLGDELISEKMWFHTIEYGSNPLSNSHVDVFFYYLRKVSKHNPKCDMKFTSTNSKFQKKMVAMLSKVDQSDNTESEINAKQDIIEIIRGRGMSCNTSWCLVDFVFLPTWLPEEKHWLLATLSFDDRAIHVCNTMANDDAELIVKKALLPFCKLLPHYLLLTEFYERSDIDFTSKFYSEKSKTDCFRLVMYNDYPRATPIHSGTYMMSIAEYFVMRKRFPKESFDLDAHRSRIAFSFYSYGMSKQIYANDSESECVDHVAGHGKALPKRTSPKKRRGGKVMTRKRKVEEVVGK